jgi:hypothetical protein
LKVKRSVDTDHTVWQGKKIETNVRHIAKLGNRCCVGTTANRTNVK